MPVGIIALCNLVLITTYCLEKFRMIYKKIKMKKIIICLIVCAIPFLISGCEPGVQNVESKVYLIPQPAQLEIKQGNFEIDANTRLEIVNGTEHTEWVAHYFKTMFKQASGIDLEILQLDKISGKTNRISLEISSDSIQKEGYLLSVSKEGIQIKANEDIGLFYGIQTLRQLLPLALDGNSENKQIQWTVPAVSIVDAPRFGWRGLHLDVSRHFFPVSFIKKYLDHMARFKLNVFHWHLVDGGGWRIQIDAYPNLTETGAWRVDKTNEPWNWAGTEIGKPTDGRAAYGGFYTKDEIREIVKYAADRFIEVIPEIEMPGHSYAALASYPELACVNNDVIRDGVHGKDVFCASNEKTFEFLETVLDETMALFPSKLNHIGGDEVAKDAWRNCPNCQQLMVDKGLKDEHELQSYFIKRMADYVESKDREIIGWDEIMEGGLAENAKVMSWRGMEGGIKSANLGHDVIMAPNSYTYFDLYQGDPSIEPPAYSRLYLTDVYKFDPIPKDIEPAKQHHILGGHACLWTETVQTPEHAEYMLFPRLFALAETVWSPKENLDWNSFVNRVEYNFKRFDKAGINYAKSSYNVSISGELDTASYKLSVVMKNELDRYQMRYTLDGSEPTINATLYEAPFVLDNAAQIKAATFKDDQVFSKVSSKEFFKHLATGKKITYKTTYNKKYNAGGDVGLVNGLVGSNDFQDGQWQGFQKDDIEVIVDLGEMMEITSLKTNFFNSPNSWIYLPENVNLYISDNGNDYKNIGRFNEFKNHTFGVNPIEKNITASNYGLNRVIHCSMHNLPQASPLLYATKIDVKRFSISDVATAGASQIYAVVRPE